jgi:hypothetical protein
MWIDRSGRWIQLTRSPALYTPSRPSTRSITSVMIRMCLLLAPLRHRSPSYLHRMTLNLDLGNMLRARWSERDGHVRVRACHKERRGESGYVLR